MLCDALIYHICPQVHYQLQLLVKLQDLVLLQLNHAEQNPEQCLFSVQQEKLHNPHRAVMLDLVNVESNEQRREACAHRKVVVQQVLVDCGVLYLQPLLDRV